MGKIKGLSFFLILPLLVFMQSLEVSAATSSSSKTSATQTTTQVNSSAKKKKWSTSLDYLYTAGFHENTQDYGTIKFSTSWKYSSKLSLYVKQTVDQLYEKNQGDSEFNPYDSRLGLSYKLAPWSYDIKPKLGFYVTVPVSELSRRNDVYSYPTLSLSLKKSLAESWALSGGSSVRYYLNRFKQTPTSLGDGGGQPLSLWRWTLWTALDYELNDKVSFSASASYLQTHSEESKFTNQISPYLGSEPRKGLFDLYPSNLYSFDFGAYYQWSEKLSFSLEYGQFTSAEQEGRVEYYLFDDEVSLWSLGVSVSL